jgi:hypothetical protein
MVIFTDAHRFRGASANACATTLALSASAATTGAVVYQLQLRHIQALRDRH